MPEMDQDQKLELARDVLVVVAQRYGFALAGSLAMDLWDLTPRLAHDIDIFAEPQRGRVVATEAARDLIATMTEAGFEVLVEDSTHNGRNVELRLTNRATDDSAMVHLVEMSGIGDPVHVDGVGPVMSMEATVELKLEALTHRRDPKDYVDVAHMVLTAGEVHDETYMLTLLVGESADVDAERYRAALRAVVEMPDSYLLDAAGIEGWNLEASRQALVYVAETVGIDQPDLLAPDVEVLLGLQGLTAEQAEAAFTRVQDALPYSLLSDVDLFDVNNDRWTMANNAGEVARDARERADRDRQHFVDFDGGLTVGVLAGLALEQPGLASRAIDDARKAAAESLVDCERNADELEGIAETAQQAASETSAEMMRRENLDGPDRAVEAIVRRVANESRVVEEQEDSAPSSVVDISVSVSAEQTQSMDSAGLRL